MYLVKLSEAECLELNRRAHERTVAPSTRDRLEMVRLSDAGWSVPKIAKHLGLDEATVRAWIKAYLAAQMPSDGHGGCGGFDALVNKRHKGKRSALSDAMLDAVKKEVEKGERTWTARQLGEWIAKEHGVALSEGRLRLHLKRAGLSWQRTSRNLAHKQDPGEVARSRAGLRSLEKGGDDGLIDVCHLDEAGFAMTLPVTSSWCVKGHPLLVPYEAPKGRRVNALGAVFTHGPKAGDFVHQTFVSLPKSQAKTAASREKGQAEIARSHGVPLDVVGPIDATRFIAFVWRIAGRPEDAPDGWKRERPLMIVLDNYSVHKSQSVQEAQPVFEAADVFLVPLPSYCPELSRIEPVWNDVKHHHLPTRSCEQVAEQKHNVDLALQRKAQQLKNTYSKSADLQRTAT